MIEITVARDFTTIKDVKEKEKDFEDPYIVLSKILATSFVEYLKGEESKEVV